LIFNFTNASDIEAIKVLNILAEVIIGEMRWIKKRFCISEKDT
jgi:hypothetical protein